MTKTSSQTKTLSPDALALAGTPNPPSAAAAIDYLMAVMARLRHPHAGCPWDLAQSYASLARHTLEEAYEVVDANNQQQPDALADELGDLLFQVVFYAQLGYEASHFNFAEIAARVANKMVGRHPHVFGDQSQKVATPEAVVDLWESNKAKERANSATEKEQPSALAGVTMALPALSRASKLQARAARVGFDWPEPALVLDKVSEEIHELTAAMESKNQAAIAEELGDVLFVLANLARKLELDPEEVLRQANQKFERRFRAMEQYAASVEKKFEELPLAAQEELWQQAKRAGVK